MTRLSRRSPGKLFSTITATSCTNTVRPIIAFTNSLYYGLASLRRGCNISDVHPCTHGSAASDVWLDGLPVTDVSAHLTSISTLQSAFEWRWGQTTGYLLDFTRELGQAKLNDVCSLFLSAQSCPKTQLSLDQMTAVQPRQSLAQLILAVERCRDRANTITPCELCGDVFQGLVRRILW